MKYECPSCFMKWEDEIKPLDRLTHPTCIFCSQKHTQKELLNWQIDHIENISWEKYPFILRYLYQYFNHRLKEMEEKYEQKEKS